MVQVTVNNQTSTNFIFSGTMKINLGDAMTVTPTFSNTLFNGDIYYAMTYPYC